MALWPGGTSAKAPMTYWTMVTDDPAVLLDLVDRHRDPSAFDRTVTLSWTQAQVQLLLFGISPSAATDFQRLGGMLMRGDPRLRALAGDAAPQSALWPYGISGDLPIALLRIDEPDDAPRLTEVLAAHDYLRMRQFAFDLVILNDRAATYVQDLQGLIEASVQAVRPPPRRETGRAPQGKVYVLRVDLLEPDRRRMLLAMASLVLVASRGSIGALVAPVVAVLVPLPVSAGEGFDTSTLEFFNSTGGFAKYGREYVIVLGDEQTPPGNLDQRDRQS